MILSATSRHLSGLCVLGGLMLGTVFLPVPVLGQSAEPDLDAINDEIRDRQSRRLGLEEEALVHEQVLITTIIIMVLLHSDHVEAAGHQQRM